MGSGCVANNSTGGFGNSFQKTPDRQVKYTGPAIPSLGICTGDTLDEIEAIILQKIVDFAQGNGILISGIDFGTCQLFINSITCCNASGDVPKELNDLMQDIFTALCTLYNDLETVKIKLNDLLVGPYNISCLTGLPANPTLKQIVQELLLEFCTLKAAVVALQTQVNTLSVGLPASIGNFLNTALQGCGNGLTKTGTGASFTASFKGFVPIGGILPYAGLLNVFDGSGMGNPGGPACGFALCNGLNGTVNMLGLVPMGSTDIPAGTQIITGASAPFNTTGGLYSVTLSAAQSGTGAHTHTISDPGHSHTMSVNLDSTDNGNAVANFMKFDATSFTNTLDGTPDVGNIHAKIRNNTTGISIAAYNGASASASHENKMPYRALYYIQRVS